MMVDAFARPLNVGDQVLYASRFGSSVYLRVLIVTEVTTATEVPAIRATHFSGGKARLYRTPALLCKLEALRAVSA